LTAKAGNATPTIIPNTNDIKIYLVNLMFCNKLSS